MQIHQSDEAQEHAENTGGDGKKLYFVFIVHVEDVIHQCSCHAKSH